MTRNRALKLAIRTRAAKTGERYTTARRHVLRELNQKSAPTALAAPVAPVPPSRGSVSDATALKKTGHDLAYWFAVLDRFGAVAKGHTAAARHLHDVHGVDGWYSQGITVAYERARGVRTLNQRCDGAFEVSTSKVMTATSAAVITAFTDAKRRARWITGTDPALADALARGLADKKSKGFVVRPDGQGRFRYKWNDTTVQLYLYPKPGGKISVTVQHTKLAGAKAVDTHRGQWKAALAALADHVTERHP
jgi:hypothetical protein